TGLLKGAPADLVVLSDDDPMLAGHGDESRLDALVFSGYPLPIDRVMVNGEWRVVDAMHVDRSRARAAYVETIQALGRTR
ncbi:MAG: formimidoylglutamate deiminase, partial [Gammaproteobacteria bacterium]|nr:formimidoylglutamate deiminase [Gammaproteobacteria bacterium]NNL49734.1 formimidoylglutamate deiminase [Woeseiaceae bacterium]